MMNSRTVIYSIIAGLACALLAAVALTRPGFLTLLIYFASVPLFFASFVWGSISGLIAAAVAIISTGLAAGGSVALVIGVSIIMPAAYAGSIVNKSRQDENGEVYWFPLSEILFRLALSVAASFMALGLWFGYDTTNVAAQFEHFIRQVLITQGGSLSVEQEAAVRTNSVFYATLVPLAIPAFSLAVLVWNMGLAEKIARGRATMARPKENIASEIGLPRMALVLFAASIVVALVFPPLRNIALVVAGTTGMAITLVGLALLHYFTWGRPGRAQILFFTYVVTVAFSIPLLLFLIVGIAELLLLLRMRDPDRMPPPNQT